MGEMPTKMFVTTDAATFALRQGQELQILLIRRANEPYKGSWCLPGGFVDKGEDLPDACARELREETSLRPAAMAQVGAWGAPGRDPRGRNVAVAYLAVVRPGKDEVSAGDDAAHAAWHTVSDLPDVGFDHADIIAAALRRLRVLAQRTHVVFALLPDEFSMGGLQSALSAVHGRMVPVRQAGAFAERAALQETATGLYRCHTEGYMRPLRMA